MIFRPLGDRVTQAIAAFRCLTRWWLQELRGLLPLTWRQRREARIEARVEEGQIRLSIVQPAQTIACRDIVLTVQTAEVFAPIPPQYAALPVWLFPPDNAVLSRILQLPRSVVLKFATLVEAEADRWTPFVAKDIVYGWSESRTIDDKRAEIELRFVPRSAVADWTPILEAHRLRPALIVLGDDQRFQVPLQDSARREAKVTPRRLLAVCLVGAIFVFALTDGIASIHEKQIWQRHVSTQSKLLSRQKDIETQIAAILSVTSRSQTGRREARARLMTTIAAALPPSDWLTDLSIKDATVTLRGYSANVELLLKALAPLASDDVVTVQGELTFDAKLERQRFTVVLRTAGVKS